MTDTPPTEGTPEETPTAVDLAAVVQQLDELASLVRTVAWGTEHTSARLEAQIATLTERVNRLQPAGKSEGDGDGDGEDEVEPIAWVDAAEPEDWRALAEWVDWLSELVDVKQSQSIPPCWPAHRGVAEELAALWRAWRAASIQDQLADGDRVIYWADRFLHPFCKRLPELQIGQCVTNTRGQHIPPTHARPTDPTHLDEAIQRSIAT